MVELRLGCGILERKMREELHNCEEKCTFAADYGGLVVRGWRGKSLDNGG